MNSSRFNLTCRKKYFNALNNGTPFSIFQFVGSEGDVSRFIARYRLSKSFQGMVLEDYSIKTILGYTAIFRLFLAWSTFEDYLKIIGIKQVDAYQLLDSTEAAELCLKINRNDTRQSFFTFIHEHTRGQTQTEVENFLQGGKVNTIYLAAAIRHVFAHGVLTPNVRRTGLRKVEIICNEIAVFLLKTIDDKFTEKILNALKLENTD